MSSLNLNNHIEILNNNKENFKLIKTEIDSFFQDNNNILILKNNIINGQFINPVKIFMLSNNKLFIILSYDQTLDKKSSYMIRIFTNYANVINFLENRHLYFIIKTAYNLNQYNNFIKNLNDKQYILFSNNNQIIIPEMLKIALYNLLGYN